MAKLPRRPDPARLADLAPEIHVLPPESQLHRVYFKGGEHPTTWSQFRALGPVSRLDHHERDAAGEPAVQDRSVVYAASTVRTAVAETFQRHRRIDRARRQPWLAIFRTTRPVPLLDLTGLYSVRAGASAKRITGPSRHAQAWSAGFYDAYPVIDGLYYRSSITNEANVVLYERGASALPDTAIFNRALSDSAWHGALVVTADEIGYQIV